MKGLVSTIDILGQTMKLCIVIGYSFRDSEINKKFFPAIKSGLKLLVLDANPPNMQENLNEAFKGIPELNERIQVSKFQFGNWGEALRNRLSSNIITLLNT